MVLKEASFSYIFIFYFDFQVKCDLDVFLTGFMRFTLSALATKC